MQRSDPSFFCSKILQNKLRSCSLLKEALFRSMPCVDSSWPVCHTSGFKLLSVKRKLPRDSAEVLAIVSIIRFVSKATISRFKNQICSWFQELNSKSFTMSWIQLNTNGNCVLRCAYNVCFCIFS